MLFLFLASRVLGTLLAAAMYLGYGKYINWLVDRVYLSSLMYGLPGILLPNQNEVMESCQQSQQHRMLSFSENSSSVRSIQYPKPNV